MPRRSLVLASGSSARLRLLQAAGFAPSVLVSGVDEASVTAPDTATLVCRLAEAKAEAVLGRAGDAVVVACDSVLELGGRQFGKPADDAEARAWLASMRGRDGVLHTGHCVVDGRTGRRQVAGATTVVRFGTFDDAELDAYLATGEARQVAGAFTIDGRSAPFVDGIDGDPGNVIGLSLPLFRRILGDLGLTVMDLWA
ncbi:MAG: Maf family protein [Actinomycetota bacterium]|nr:Maf family protein [Actinomycetota bacterium]